MPWKQWEAEVVVVLENQNKNVVEFAFRSNRIFVYLMYTWLHSPETLFFTLRSFSFNSILMLSYYFCFLFFVFFFSKLKMSYGFMLCVLILTKKLLPLSKIILTDWLRWRWEQRERQRGERKERKDSETPAWWHFDEIQHESTQTIIIYSTWRRWRKIDLINKNSVQTHIYTYSYICRDLNR